MPENNSTDFSSRFSGRTVLVVGDVMLDQYVWGSVDRISPEAPVQVVAVTRETDTLGGSGNVVNNLSALGAHVMLASVIGGDRDGRRILEILTEKGVDVSGVIADPDRPTTRKTRVIAASQQVLRIDRETRQAIARDQERKLAGFVAAALPGVDAVLISDYAKGVITAGLCKKIFKACREGGVPAVADPKGLRFGKYRNAFAITPNKKEALAAASLADAPGAVDKAGIRLLKDLDVDRVLITCGRDGMALFSKEGPPVFIRAEARQVFDVSGAGDTVLAVLGLGLASGLDAEEAARLANTAAGIVVGKVGTATVGREELEKAVGAGRKPVVGKVVGLSELSRLVGEARRRGKTVVLTNGCFDLLHSGHVMLLEASKKLGDLLVVALDDDPSVRAIKGAGRPVIGADQRVRIISALDSVDFVTVFATEDLEKVLETVRPDVLTKGSNYASDRVKGEEFVRGYGGRVELIPIDGETSTSGIIRSIRSGNS